jgi:hypothetical protein
LPLDLPLKKNKEKRYYGSLLGSDSILVKDMTHNPKIKGSKAATGTGRDNMA